MKPLAIVAGALAVKTGNGGNAWSRVSLVLGLRRLGFQAILLEQLPGASEEQRSFFESVCRRFEIEGVLLDDGAPADLVARAGAADLLLDLGGHLTLEPLKRGPRVRVYVDDDPAYTQFWHAEGLLGDRLEGYDAYFTFGENIGRPGCTIPTDGIPWRPTRPPVVLDEWPVATNAPRDRFTTVASWRGAYGRVEVDGRLLGQKAHEFRRFVELPGRAAETFEVALDIDSADSADVALLRGHGWHLVEPRRVAASPDDFRRYVQGSGGEFSVAQGIYVETGSGWLSDRTTRYLASGKPVLVQDTGFSRNLPTGEGLLAFATIEQALAGVEAIRRDYDAHAGAARRLAEEHFDADKVLGRLLEEAGL